MPLAVACPAGRRPRRRRAAAVAALLGIALLLGGCGSDDGTPASEAGRDGKTSAFPATIAQKLGDVTIEAEPKRVVALDFPSADNALALGVVPVGMAEVSYVEGGFMAWTRAALGDRKTAIFNVDKGFTFETIVKLNPDVILATNTYPLIAEHWDKLNAIAPVVGHVEKPEATRGSRVSRRSARRSAARRRLSSSSPTSSRRSPRPAPPIRSSPARRSRSSTTSALTASTSSAQTNTSPSSSSSSSAFTV